MSTDHPSSAPTTHHHFAHELRSAKSSTRLCHPFATRSINSAGKRWSTSPTDAMMMGMFARQSPKNPERWSHGPSNRDDPTRSGSAISDDAVDPLVLDLSPSSSSMRVAIPAPSESASEPARAHPPKKQPPSVTAQALPALAERLQTTEALASEAPRLNMDGLEEPRLEDLDAGFDSLLEEHDRLA
jgi:hypothetical protein